MTLAGDERSDREVENDVLTDKIGPFVSRVRLCPGTSRAIPAIYELLASPENDGLTRKRAEALNEVCFALARESRDPRKARCLYKEVAYHTLALQRNSPSEAFCRVCVRLPTSFGLFSLSTLEYLSRSWFQTWFIFTPIWGILPF